MKFPLPACLLLGLLPFPLSAQGWREEADELLRAGQIDRAVIAIERWVDAAPGDAEAWRALGGALERLVLEAAGPWLALEDARDAWDRALALEPFDVETLRGAALVRLRLGEHADAAALALRALGTASLVDGEVPRGLRALACRARIGAFQSVQHDDLAPWASDLEQTWAIVRAARAAEPGDPELALVQAGLLDGLGLPEVAAEVLFGAIEASPGAADLHRMLVDIHGREGVQARLPSRYERMVAGSPDPTLAWYAGWVARLGGDLAQRERDFPSALDAYARCAERMRGVAATEPSFRASADTIRVQAEVSTVWCLIEMGDFDGAEERALALLRDEPDRREVPDGLGRSAMNAVARLGEHWVELQDFGRGARIARSVVAAAPEEGGWWNNLGFLLREHGTQMESGAFPDVPDPKARAREIFQESWSAYRRAAELAPEDARVVNDGALIQVYHLRDELELAVEMLWQAIRAGEAQLAAMGPQPDERERFPVAQAVGDAYQNLGYLYYHVLDEPKRSREFWVKSMATDSGDRGTMNGYLDAIDGKRDPLPERDASGFMRAPLAGLPERAAIPWEASLAEARDRARGLGRTLVVYDRGYGLGLGIPFLDRFATSPDFAERTAGAVVVVCDRLRHTFVDRARDGRRVLCPRWGTITCAEHLACAEDFDAWLRELGGGEPGEAQEGFHVVRAGEDAPVQVRGLRALDELVSPGESPPPPDPDALAGPGGERAAWALVTTRSRAARSVVEGVLLERDAPAEVRRRLVEALARDDHPTSHELLAAAVRQLDDPALALLALGAWPTGLELAPVELASRWAPDAAVRQAAGEVLARDLPGFERRLEAHRIVSSR